MGFSQEKAKKAMQETNSNALNDLIDFIIKDLSTEQPVAV